MKEVLLLVKHEIHVNEVHVRVSSCSEKTSVVVENLMFSNFYVVFFLCVLE